jgi:hypothetical protein
VSGVGELPPFPHTLPSAETVFRPRLLDDRPEHTQGEAFLSHLSPPPRSSGAVARCRARVSRLKPSLAVAGADPGQGAAREGTTTTPVEKTARAVPQSLGEGRPGRLWGRIGFFSREGLVVTNLPQVDVETARKVRRLPVAFPHGSTGARAAGDDRAGPERTLGFAGRYCASKRPGEPFALPPDVLLVGTKRLNYDWRLANPEIPDRGAAVSSRSGLWLGAAFCVLPFE